MKNNPVQSLNLIGVVKDICSGEHEKFVVVYQCRYTDTFPVGQRESITFSIDVWSEVDLPAKNDEVILLGVRLMRCGWRACRAMPFKESDCISLTK